MGFTEILLAEHRELEGSFALPESGEGHLDLHIEVAFAGDQADVLRVWGREVYTGAFYADKDALLAELTPEGRQQLETEIEDAITRAWDGHFTKLCSCSRHARKRIRRRLRRHARPPASRKAA